MRGGVPGRRVLQRCCFSFASANPSSVGSVPFERRVVSVRGCETVRPFPSANWLPPLQETCYGQAPVGAGRFSEPVAGNALCGMLPGPSDLSDCLVRRDSVREAVPEIGSLVRQATTCSGAVRAGESGCGPYGNRNRQKTLSSFGYSVYSSYLRVRITEKKRFVILIGGHHSMPDKMTG